MKKLLYLPTDDKGKRLLVDNFADKFAKVAIMLGFTADDITNVNKYKVMFAWLLNAVPARIFPIIGKMVERIKAHPKYTENCLVLK